LLLLQPLHLLLLLLLLRRPEQESQT